MWGGGGGILSENSEGVGMEEVKYTRLFVIHARNLSLSATLSHVRHREADMRKILITTCTNIFSFISHISLQNILKISNSNPFLFNGIHSVIK